MTFGRRHLLHLALGSAAMLLTSRRGLTSPSGRAEILHWLATADSAKAVSTYGFASLHADAGSLTIEAWNTSGQQLDRARLDRGGALI